MEEMTMLKVLDLCSGIAGGTMGIIAANLHHKIEPAMFVENNFYCQKVLAKWFPSIPIHSNIEDFHAKPGQYQIAIASFPCQNHSLAGGRKGSEDERNLWPHVYRILKQLEPIGFILENVPGIRHSDGGQFLRNILKDIAALGTYECEWATISVKSLGGVHERERFFFIAYPQSKRWMFEQLAIAAQTGANSPLGSQDCTPITPWTSVISKAVPTHARLSTFLAGCLMKHEDLEEALKTATVEATTAELREPLQAIGNSIAPMQVAQVWQKLYEKLCYLER